MSNHSSIFNDEYLIKYVEESIESNFQPQVFDPKSYYDNMEHEKMINSIEYEFYTEYQNLKGNLISSFEEYEYWYDLFVVLTGARIGNYSPIHSTDGFDHFYKILSKTYKGQGFNMKKEFNIFFRSIDNVYAYT